MEKIELFDAFYWKCSTCEEVNFCKPVKLKISKQEQEEILKDLDIDYLEPGEKLEVYGYPKKVICSRCKTSFKSFMKEDELFKKEEKDIFKGLENPPF